MASYAKHPGALALVSACVAFYHFTRVVHIVTGYEQTHPTAPDGPASPPGNESRGSEARIAGETRRALRTARDAA